jgi:hypothetical protein
VKRAIVIALLVACASSSSPPADHGPCVELGEALECTPDPITLKTCYRCVLDGDGGVCCRCCS